jgi:hypothetical protein
MLTPISPPRGAEIPTEAAPQPRASARVASGPAPEAAPGTPNPSLRLDPALGPVVLEFRDVHGRTATLPTERELAAYRIAGGPPDATAPVPAAGAGAPEDAKAEQPSTPTTSRPAASKIL